MSGEKTLLLYCDLKEDTNDFSWASTKASHVVLLCEMERGTVDWSNTSNIDRICRAHTQRHTSGNKKTVFKTKTYIANHGSVRHIRWACASMGQIMTSMVRPINTFVHFV